MPGPPAGARAAVPHAAAPASSAASKSESVLVVVPVIRRELARHVRDPALLDDLFQDVLVRLIAAADRLDPSTLTAYARVVAHNVARSHQRDERNRHRKLARAASVAPRATAGADEDADLSGVERAALEAALDQLSASDRLLLQDLATASDDAAKGTVRVRLLRARARARVRYLLELRGMTPPTDRCLRVLDALSAGDRTRQRMVGAATHLAHCAHCELVAEEVVRRRLPLPILLIAGGTAGLWRFLRQHSAASVAGASAAVAVGVAAAALSGGGPATDAPPPVVAPPPSTAAPAPPPVSATAPLTLAATNRALLPLPDDLAALVGSPVRADGVSVRSTVGDEAFWVGSSDDEQLLVVLVDGGESPEQIGPGQRVDFTGVLAANAADTPAVAGVDAAEHLDLLARQGVHLEVRSDALTVR